MTTKTKWELTWWEIPDKPIRLHDGYTQIDHGDGWEEMTPDDAIEKTLDAPSKMNAVQMARKILKDRKPKMYWGEIRICHLRCERTNFADGGPEFWEWEESGEYDPVEL